MEIVHRYVMSDTRIQQSCRYMENVHRYVMSDTRTQQCCRYISPMRYVMQPNTSTHWPRIRDSQNGVVRIEVGNKRMLKQQ
jgi:hypothetical protein